MELKVVGFRYEVNGKVVILPQKIDGLVRFITKDEFEKDSKNMMSKYVAHLCTRDISNQFVNLYYIKS